MEEVWAGATYSGGADQKIPPKKLLLCVLAFFFVRWAPNALFCSLMATFYLYCCENRWF